MDFSVWLAFFAAASIILIIPGPTILLVISQAITHGRRSAGPLVAGVACGDFLAMTLSLVGLGAVLSASATLFAVFKWVGALYLIYLGIRLWRTAPEERPDMAPMHENRGRRLFKRAFVVTALNPKSIAFFVAFIPQFIRPQEPMIPQLALLEVTFVSLAAINAAVYAFFAAHLSETMQKRNVRKWLNRCGAGALLGAGLATAAMRRTV